PWWKSWACERGAGALPRGRFSGVHAPGAPAAPAEALVGVLRHGVPGPEPRARARPGRAAAVPRPRLAPHPRARVSLVLALRHARRRGGPRHGHGAVHVDPA